MIENVCVIDGKTKKKKYIKIRDKYIYNNK